MYKIIALAFGLLAVSAYADTGSPELKKEAKAVIQAADYKCDKVNAVFPAHFGGSVKVYCDDVYIYIIKDKGGHYVVEVDD